MRSILRKCAVGAVVVGGMLVVQPGNFAEAAKKPDANSAAIKCVNANDRARQVATNQFHKDIRAARALPTSQQQAAVDAAKAKFTTAAQQAKDAFNACIAAAKAA